MEEEEKRSLMITRRGRYYLLLLLLHQVQVVVFVTAAYQACSWHRVKSHPEVTINTLDIAKQPKYKTDQAKKNNGAGSAAIPDTCTTISNCWCL